VNLRSRMGLAGALVVACTVGVVAPVFFQAESGIVAEQFDASLASTAQHRLAVLMVALACCGALVAVLVMALLTGRILRPARRLTVAVEHVTATGDLTADLGIRERRGRGDELGRLAASFGVMMRAPDDSLQAQRRLVADASHELRTPLTSLTTNLDLLDEVSGSPDPLTPELVRDVRAQAHELRSLVNDLIDLARFTSVETHTEDTRLDLLVRRAVQRTSDLATARTREIGFELHLEECLVPADPDAVHRAIANLLDNAVKWSPSGGVIHVELRTTEDGHAEFGVRAEGPGIPPEDLPHVFDRFYRSPTTRALPGSGLGLAIVRQIAEQHHGSVLARPCSPGAHILLRLPLSATA
jgi:two-component system sensor histidine kinase MprB